MFVIALNGSRNKEGQTAQALAAFTTGLESAGASVETLVLPEQEIERCRQCENDGWGTCREGRCSIEDGFAPIFQSIRAADRVVMATPVYFGDLSESLLALLTRLRRVAWFTPKPNGIAEKPAVGICVAGGGGGGAPRCCDVMQHVLSTCGFDVKDVIPARRQNLGMKVDALRVAGAWFGGMLD